MISTVWQHTNKYLTRKSNFSVEVVHSKTPGIYTEENHWCIYAYIYSNHPSLELFTSDEIYQNATESFPFHGGCSFVRRNYNSEGEVVSVQVGCDYNHYRDDDYLTMSTIEEAGSIFYDAEKLVKYLEGYKNDRKLHKSKTTCLLSTLRGIQRSI